MAALHLYMEPISVFTGRHCRIWLLVSRITGKLVSLQGQVRGPILSCSGWNGERGMSVTASHTQFEFDRTKAHSQRNTNAITLDLCRSMRDLKSDSSIVYFISSLSHDVTLVRLWRNALVLSQMCCSLQDEIASLVKAHPVTLGISYTISDREVVCLTGV